MKQMLLALDLDSSPGVIVFSVIDMNADTFDAAAYAARAGRNTTDASSTPGAAGAITT